MATNIPTETGRSKTVVLLGRKGDGKSSTGNTLLGHNYFPTKLKSPKILTLCVEGPDPSMPNDSKLNVIDTPGLFSTDISNDEVEKELSRIFVLAPDGVDAFALVLRAGRFTAELQNTIKYVKELFGADVMKRTVVVFAGLDDLEFDGVTFEEYIKNMPKDIAKILPELKIAFDNRSASDEQKQQHIDEFHSLVAQMRNKVKYTAANVPAKSTMNRWIQLLDSNDLPSAEKRMEESSGSKTEPVEISKPHDSKSPSQEQSSILHHTSVHLTPEGSTKQHYAKKEEAIPRMKIAVIGNDSEDFITKLLESFPNFKSEAITTDASQSAGDPCVSHQGMIGDRYVLFVNAGTLDLHESEINSHRVIDSLFKRASGGPHWFFLVVRVGTDKDALIRLLSTFKRVFGEGIMKYTVVVLSNSSSIINYSKGLASYLGNLPKKVRVLMQYTVDKDLVWAFDKEEEEFKDRMTKCTINVYDRAKKRGHRERCFKYEMAPTLEKADQEVPSVQPTGRRLTIQMIAAPFLRARDRCTIA